MRSNFDWRAWAKLDPLYGVATMPGKSRGSARPWTDEAFYELGRRDWDAFRPHWEQYGVSRASCLEIGCGAGRLTAHLARYFLSVDAVDVSPEMVDYARQHAGLDGVRFHVTDGVRLPLVENSMSAVFSTHAFRYLESPSKGAKYFREIHRVMTPDATLMIHLPVIMWPWGPLQGLHDVLKCCRSSLMGMAVHLREALWSLGLTQSPAMRVIWCGMNWLHALKDLQFSDIEIWVITGDSPMAVQHPFLFARKRNP